MLIGVLTLGGVLVACSPDETDFRDAAVDAIEGDVADQIGVDDLTAECEEPADDAVGTTFACTAEHPDGEIRITSEIVEDDEVNVQTLNLLVPEDMPMLEESASQALSESTGAALAPEALDCGDGAVIVSAGPELVCAYTADDGAVYDATITWRGDTTDDGFDVEIAETSR